MYKKLDDSRYCYIITCSHNLVRWNDKLDKKQAATNLWYLPKGSQYENVRLKCIDWIYNDKYDPVKQHCAYDIGIILCYDKKEYYHNINANKLFQIDAWKKKKLSGCNIYGYPSIGGGKLMGMSGKAITVDTINKINKWKYENINTYPGQSGSVLFKEDDDDDIYFIYGIHIFGDTDSQINRAVKFNDQHIQWICDTENKMKQKAQQHKMRKKAKTYRKVDQTKALKVWMEDTVKITDEFVGKYFDLLKEDGWDLETILDITVNDLARIGIDKGGHRKKIYTYAQILKASKLKAEFEEHKDEYKDIDISKQEQIILEIHSNQGELSKNDKAENILEANNSNYYFSGYNNVTNDWINMEVLNDNIYYPTMIKVMGCDNEDSLRHIKVKIGNVDKNEWIEMNEDFIEVKRSGDKQEFKFDIDNDKGKLIKAKNYKQFQLEIKDNYGSEKWIVIGEFLMFGVPI
eukprot:212152_1